jgi:hypothetical protein
VARIDHETGSTLSKALRKEFPLPQYAVLYEVANGMSATFSGYADAIVMGLFPSRGLDIHGFEFKSNRPDWLKELKNPAKAEPVAKYCDYFWLLATNEGIVQKDELPATWGLYVLEGKHLEVRKRAKRLQATPPDRPFIGAMLRRANEMADREKRRAQEKIDKDDVVRDAKKEADRYADERFKSEFSIATQEYQALKHQVEEFEKASGIKIDMWNGKKMGEAVSLLSRLKTTREIDSLAYLAKDLEERIQDVKRGAEELKQVATSFYDAGTLST